MEPDFFFYPLIVIGSPFGAFALGVFIADRAGLYSHMTRRTLYLTAVPTGLLFPAFLAGSAVVIIEGTVHYGYMQHWTKLVMFCGTLMVYGSASPELFAAIRARILETGRTNSGGHA